MKRCLVLVEGFTEERFVKTCLVPHFERLRIALIPKVVTTKRVKAGTDFKGGILRYQQIRDDLQRLLGDSGAVAVTTLIDYYGLPSDVPGLSTLPAGLPQRRVAHVEAALKADIAHPRFIPHLVLHEFEAWVFCNPSAYAWVFEDDSVVAKLQDIRDQVETPEAINEGTATAPSKRILAIYPRYRKTLHGPMAVEAIGLDEVRAQCPHFDAWLSRLEALGR